LVNIVNVSNIRMVKSGGCSGLFHEPALLLRIGDSADTQKLKSDDAVQAARRA